MVGTLLREQLREQDPTVQDLELAAEHRLNDGLTLMAGGRFWGAVYLLGYVAEMYLKIIAYRRAGARPTSQAHVMFRQCRRRAGELRLMGHDDQWEGGHGLLFWARLIWSMPGRLGGALEGDCRYALYRHVWRVEQHWSVNMRYSARLTDRLSAGKVLASVEWLRRRRVALWR